ncbi:thiamine kinase-like enzyme [Paenibacillus castaneae]|uniref:aminoglycoside phosphotransferase family protein n=1 Tax=Paenibacillus castaneae TaxID=474957 RepID=UPI000C9AEAC2|nr:aminoglycoside phosphotransferase family protein [Paenibacillus castaneae]NIK75407.1 thiamine kinase-like enzyme [Paenibacillus castaneae]
MEQLLIHIRKKVEELLHEKVDYIQKIENVPNNSVYKVLVTNKLYIFKIYKQRDWPEDGKLLFVNHTLIENNIGCAKMIAFDRNDSNLQTGFLIEEYLLGENADHIVFNPKSGKAFYKKFAQLISKIHRIRIENYGYIGTGIAGYKSFIDFVNDEYDDRANNLINKKLFDEQSLLEIKKTVIEKLRLCESLPSVLCHGDLSTKNVIIDEHGDLTLIDWDDAMSYSWIADVARMTYWMKFHYNAYEYEMYRNTFMEHYSTELNKSEFHTFENTFHIWIGLDHLNYYANTPQCANTLTYFNETIEKLNK